jgi:hypothetical protein
MADYRNLPFKFGMYGLNLVSSPENMGEGQYRQLINARFRRDGALEARPSAAAITALVTLPGAGGTQTGPASLWPDFWNVQTLEASRYIGKILQSANSVDGWIFFYLGRDSGLNGNTDDYRVFINGMPVALASSGCFTGGSNYTALQPTGYSILRATAKTGIPVIILDGQYWMALKDINMDIPSITEDNYQPGDIATVQITVPVAVCYDLGITAPGIPTNQTEAAGNVSGNNFYWRATYQNAATGFESPAGTSTAVDANVASKKITWDVARSTDPQVDTIRLWRKGGTLTSWRLADTQTYNICQGSGDVTMTDNSSDATISTNEELLTTWTKPYSSITAAGVATAVQPERAFGPFLERYMFSVGDTVRKGYIYWNTSGDLSRYNATDNVNAISDPGDELQNGFVFGSLAYVFSRKNLYALDYGGPGAVPEFTPRKTGIGHGMVGKWSFAVGSTAVYFMDQDGIYATTCQPGNVVSLTENSIKPIFQGTAGTPSQVTYADSATFPGLEAIDFAQKDTIRMTATSKELHVFYKGTSGEAQHIVYDLERNAWSEWQSGAANVNEFVSGYADEGNSSTRIILGPSNSPVPRVVDDAQPAAGTITDLTYLVEDFDVVVRTGAIDHGIPLTFKEYGSVMLDMNMDSIRNMYVSPLYNQEETTGTLITVQPDLNETSREAHALTLGDTYGRSISLQIRWNEEVIDLGSDTFYRCHPVIYQGNLLFREDEEDITHWEMPPTSFGIDGQFHLKDGWFTIRTQEDTTANDPREADLTLTVVVDDTYTDTYVLTKTNGKKLKRYVEFKPRRGRLFQFKIDSDAPQGGSAYTKTPFRFYGEDSFLRGKPWITGASYQTLTPFGAVGYAQYRRTEGGT